MKRFGFGVLSMVLAFFSCVSPVTNGNGTLAQTVDLNKPGSVIKNLTFGTVSLPKSLQDGSTNTSARAARSPARALGDVTTLTSLSLPSLKASGYQSFRNQVDNPTVVKLFLEALKGVPSIADGSLPVNTVVDTGNINIVTPYGSLGIKNSGKLSTSLSSDGQTLNIFWNMLYPDQTQVSANMSDPNFQSQVDAASRINIYLYFIVQKSGAAELYAYRPVASGTGYYMNYYAKADPTDNTAIQAQDSLWSGTTSSQYLDLVLPQSGGGILLYHNSLNGGNSSYESMGYADDNFGGLVSVGTSTYDDDGSGPDPAAAHGYLNVEFYDGTGDLVYQGWGDSARNANNWNWRFDQNQSTNVYAIDPVKHATFKTREVWNGSTTVRSISFDNGVTWTPYTSTGSSLVYHDTTTDAGSWNIKTGDAIYWGDSWNSSWDSVAGTWTWEQSFYKGYEVPTGESYFGQNFFVNKTYPLKNLLPLRAEYSTGYDVKQQEGTTYYSWMDMGGGWHYGDTSPAANSFKPNSLYTWTNYSYWLENKNYSGSVANDPLSLDIDKGDVSVQLQDMQVWYWDQTTGRSISKKAPAYSTYQSDLPPYFALSQSKLDAVAGTKARLESFYATKANYTTSVYLTGYQAKIDVVLPSFPSLSGYPGFVP